MALRRLYYVAVGFGLSFFCGMHVAEGKAAWFEGALAVFFALSAWLGDDDE